MGEANRLVGLKPGDEYYEFYGLLEEGTQVMLVNVFQPS